MLFVCARKNSKLKSIFGNNYKLRKVHLTRCETNVSLTIITKKNHQHIEYTLSFIIKWANVALHCSVWQGGKIICVIYSRTLLLINGRKRRCSSLVIAAKKKDCGEEIASTFISHYYFLAQITNLSAVLHKYNGHLSAQIHIQANFNTFVNQMKVSLRHTSLTCW